MPADDETDHTALLRRIAEELRTIRTVLVMLVVVQLLAFVVIAAD